MRRYEARNTKFGNILTTFLGFSPHGAFIPRGAAPKFLATFGNLVSGATNHMNAPRGVQSKTGTDGASNNLTAARCDGVR